jgi:hypothetical protein
MNLVSNLSLLLIVITLLLISITLLLIVITLLLIAITNPMVLILRPPNNFLLLSLRNIHGLTVLVHVKGHDALLQLCTALNVAVTCIVKPNPLAVLPLAFPLDSFTVLVPAPAMLHSLGPLPLVVLTRGPIKLAVTVFAVVLIFADILSAVLPLKSALTVHDALFPGPLINSAVMPLIFPCPMHEAMQKITRILRTVPPDHLPLAAPFVVTKHALVSVAVLE